MCNPYSLWTLPTVYFNHGLLSIQLLRYKSILIIQSKCQRRAESSINKMGSDIFLGICLEYTKLRRICSLFWNGYIVTLNC